MARSGRGSFACTQPAIGWSVVAVCALLASGCSRTHYRTRADRDALSVLYEKTAATPWASPPGYDVQPDPRSRLYDPTPIDDPVLPVAAPQLYTYELPDLSTSGSSSRSAPDDCLAMVSIAVGPASSNVKDNEQAMAPPEENVLRLVVATADPAGGDVVAPATFETTSPETSTAQAPENRDRDIGISPITIPSSAWQSVPESCRARMLEFSSVRDEYHRTFGIAPFTADALRARRLKLAEIVQLMLLNSREYQTQKEQLYRVALRLTLERFDYDPKFSATGNTSAVDFTHSRTGAITEDTLRIPTRLRADKLLFTGGSLIARFANNVVLTFNGPSGFAADIGSDVLIDLSQTVFQRDVVFEPLTQAERDVVYAARDFARFRKTLFFQLATQYYDLLLTHRQVEIDTQNYFTLVRAFLQREAEYRVGLVPRVQVDQVEQNALEGRSSLIETCNRLERALDSLKLRIGLPTETVIDLDLTELERLTLRDEVAVTSQLVSRVHTRLQAERDRESPNRSELLNVAIELVIRVLDSAKLRQRLQQSTADVTALRILQARLQTEEAQWQVRRDRAQLVEDRQDPAAPEVRILRGTTTLIGSQLDLIEQQLAHARISSVDDSFIGGMEKARDELANRFTALQASHESVLADLEIARIPDLLRTAEQISSHAAQTVSTANKVLGISPKPRTEQQRLHDTLVKVDGLLQHSQSLLNQAGQGLVPVDLEMDDAMMTALFERLDLMNERGFLADDWRQIKLAADDLKSVLNLGASQIISTRRDVNRVLDLTFDESQTRLSASFDAPLNRRSQRNQFRERLMDYQLGRRQLMEREDNIKFAVRNDLRNLALAREQYVLSVASAALAFERVVSTALQLQLGVANVAARDFLEAQTAYARSLSSLAGRHIDHIVNRTQLFLNLELMELDDAGFWPGLYDEEFQPLPSYSLPPHALPMFGELPRHVHFSRRMMRMLETPVEFEPAIDDAIGEREE